MTVDELIPVLKTLHANPTTALVFADWFEERGEPRVGEMLRGFNRTNPVVSLWHSRRLIELLTLSVYWDSEHRHGLLEKAVIEECVRRVRWDDGDVAAAVTGLEISCELLRGRSNLAIMLVPAGARQITVPEPGQPIPRMSELRSAPAASMIRTRDVRLHKFWVQFDPPSADTLDGGWLTFRTTFFVGVMPDGRAVRTEFEQATTFFSQYNAIPF